MPSAPDSSFVGITSNVGSSLRSILDSDDLKPGDDPSYQVCKAIYIAHPLGAKMAESPIRLAQSQEREIEVSDGPEEVVVEKFLDEWRQMEATRNILNLGTQARVYGISSIGMTMEGTPPDRPVSLRDLWKQDIGFNVWDPLNTAGSLVTSQDPNSRQFQKWGDLVVNGQRYHRSRSVTLMNEEPLYIAFTTSAFGFVGRSVYQRAFYPLKSFLQTMITDDMVTRKAGVLVAKMEQPGSIVDRVMRSMFGLKRALLREAKTDNVLSIGTTEDISTLNMQNVDGAFGMARNNIIKNVATAADMPAKLLTQEAYVEGFGEGTQDAYAVAQYVDRVRIELQHVYAWFDLVCMYRAWNEDFYKDTVQRRFPDEYGEMPYLQAFYKWKNSFKATWPSLIKEPPSDQVEVDDVKLKATIAILQVMGPLLDPSNRVRLIQTFYDIMNSHELIFGGARFELDAEELEAFIEEQSQQSPADLGAAENASKPPRPFATDDSAHVAAIADWVRERPRLRRGAAR